MGCGGGWGGVSWLLAGWFAGCLLACWPASLVRFLVVCVAGLVVGGFVSSWDGLMVGVVGAD